MGSLKFSYHWALHDAFEEDEVQVIGSRGACAVTQCVQGLMHGYKTHTHRHRDTEEIYNVCLSPLPCATLTHGKKAEEREREGGRERERA